MFATSAIGAVAIAVTLAVNLARGYPIALLAAALVVAGLIYCFWVRAGRPRGVSDAEAAAAAEA